MHAAWDSCLLLASPSCLLNVCHRLLAHLAAMAPPTEAWLHSCLNLIHWRIRDLDPEGLAAVAVSLAKLKVLWPTGRGWTTTCP